MAIPHGFIQELLNRVDVVEVVGRHVQLKKTGANLSGLCPFHSEKPPSFTVSPTKQFYHCFGCGKNGDAVNFLMEFNGLGFVDAVQELAQQHGMQVPDDRLSPQDRAREAAQRHKQTTLSDVLEKATADYKKQLKSSAIAIDYLKQRGLTGEMAARFGLGYAPPGWRHLSAVFGDYADPLLEESGLVIRHAPEDAAHEAHTEHAGEKRYDRFRHRIMFPIRNAKGVCIGFGGRVLGDEKPKYLNSPETPVFSKGRELYGLYEARNAMREHGYVLVTEGYMDVVALAQLGFANAVATLGTACTSEHLQKLFRQTDAVVFSFDGDAAGRNAAHKALHAALPYATDTRSVKFLFLPPEHDPDSFIRAHGADAFAQAVEHATPLSQFLRDAASQGCDLASTEGRAKLAAQAAPLWQALPEGVFKRQLLGDLSRMIQLETAELETLWGANVPAAASSSTQNPPASSKRPTGQNQPASPVERAQMQTPPLYASSRSGPRKSLSPWSSPARPRRGARAAIHSQADHALRHLLGDMAAWDNLTPDQHQILLAQPYPHGAFFAWIDSQQMEHGAQPWSALRVALQTEATDDFAALAQQLMGSDHRLVEPDRSEFMQNVRALHLQHLKQQQAMAYAQHDLAMAERVGQEIAQLNKDAAGPGL